MKKILVFATLIIFIVNLSVLGKSVNPETAKNAARNFVLHQSQTLIKSAELELFFTLETNDPVVLSKTGTQAEPVYYIYNVNKNGGFIIMAGDDAVTPVLGYSFTSGYSGQNMPPALVKLLEKYKQEIIFIKQNGLEADAALARDWYQLTTGKFVETRSGSAVSPLCSTTWDQSPYYNAQCPYDYTYSQRTVTGCAATAMAQIMKFWNYPANGTGFHSYSHNTYGTLSANFGNTSYDWGNMPNHLTGSSTAVATLMYHCGVSVEMNYGVASQGGSGAYVISSASPVTHCVEYALKTYFGYNSTMLQGLERKNYTDATWISKLKTDLDAGRPIQYAGFGQGGHTFVCDGYDNSNNFHFNWGWGGMYDGYFNINALNPGSGGTGGGAGTYNNGQQALLGIKPITGGGGNASLQIYSSITITPNPITYANSFTVNVDVWNNGSTTYNDSFVAAIFNSSGVFVDIIDELPSGGLPSGYHYTSGLTFSNTGLTSATPGNYIIAFYYKNATNGWQLIPAGSYANTTWVTIQGIYNEMSLYDSISPTPQTIVQKQAFSVHTDIANYGSTSFNGDISIDLHDISGKWISTIDQKTGVSLNAGYHWTSGVTFNSTGLDVDPGNYLLVVWDKPSGGSWEIVGSGSYSNPVTVRIVVPSLNPDPYERNNTIDSTYNFPVTFTGNSATVKTTGSNIHFGQDYDFYKFNLPAGYTYTINARVHDEYNSGDGNTYTADVLFAYRKGTTWSDTYDDVMPGSFTINNGDPLIIYVAPYFLGNTGTYLLDIGITRSTTPAIAITAPATGTDWRKGSTNNITWTDNISENVIIELFKGTSQVLTISSSTASNGSYSWLVPGTLAAATDYRIKITSVSDNNINTYSNYFTISDLPSITVTDPTGSSTWKKGETHDITWTDNISDNVIIELFKGTSQMLTISSSAASNGTYSWILPTSLVAASDYRIKITSTADNGIFDYSDYFTVSESTSVGNNDVSLTGLFPNPADNQLFLTINRVDHAYVKIINTLGKVVLILDNLQFTNNKTEINISALSDGLYYLYLFNNGKFEVKTFVKKGR